MKPYILIIEYDPDIAESIRYNLEREGAFIAQVALSGEDGLNIALGNGQIKRTGDLNGQSPDLAILDLNLPGMSGFELCRRLRTEEMTRRMPIIVLTARTEEGDKVRGLDLGADDYMTKPFSVRELVARVRAALRRSGYESQSPKLYNDGFLRIDYADFAVACQGQNIKLTRKEFALLAILSRNKGRVVPREQLLDQVWGRHFEGDPSTVTVHIRRLREKIERDPSNPQHLQTVWGVGYRFET